MLTSSVSSVVRVGGSVLIAGNFVKLAEDSSVTTMGMSVAASPISPVTICGPPDGMDGSVVTSVVRGCAVVVVVMGIHSKNPSRF